MVRYYHQLSGQESEQTLGDSGGQRNLAGCSPYDGKESNNLVTEQQQIMYDS